MALIRVNSAVKWHCSSKLFQKLLGDVQKALPSAQADLRKRLQTALDSDLHWWSMATLGAAEYESFLAAVRTVEEEWSAAGPASLADLDRYAGYLGRLRALTHALETDRRGLGHRTGGMEPA